MFLKKALNSTIRNNSFIQMTNGISIQAINRCLIFSTRIDIHPNVLIFIGERHDCREESEAIGSLYFSKLPTIIVYDDSGGRNFMYVQRVSN